MQLLIISFFAMLFLMGIMAIGVILGRKPIKGSCGGVGAALGDPNYVCELCGNDPAKCEKESEKASTDVRNLFYDANKKS